MTINKDEKKNNMKKGKLRHNDSKSLVIKLTTKSTSENLPVSGDAEKRQRFVDTLNGNNKTMMLATENRNCA